MPKATPPAAKQALILAWIQKSGTAHNIKDLEKALPSVASINSMHVKDYLQALSDENMIRVEKIGSGNWYWSFPSDEKAKKDQALDKILAERDKAAAAAEVLQQRLDDAMASKEDDEDEEMLMGAGNDRTSLTLKNADLEKEVENLKCELGAYSDNDPAEIERRKCLLEAQKQEAQSWADQVLSMESWIKSRVSNKEQLLAMKRNWYGDEFDEEEGGLREL